MKDQFYTELVSIESIIVELDQMDLSQEERLHLAKLFESTLHHTILDAVLSELSSEDKQVFLNHLSKKENDKIWELLNEKIDKIEEKIKVAAEDLKKEMHKDIREAKIRKEKI